MSGTLERFRLPTADKVDRGSSPPPIMDQTKCVQRCGPRAAAWLERADDRVWPAGEGTGIYKYAAEHDWLTVFQLPSYAPDLNPVGERLVTSSARPDGEHRLRGPRPPHPNAPPRPQTHPTTAPTRRRMPGRDRTDAHDTDLTSKSSVIVRWTRHPCGRCGPRCACPRAIAAGEVRRRPCRREGVVA